jgi:hypothetical protein
MKRLLVSALASMLLIALPSVVLANHGGGSSALSHQLFRARTGAISSFSGPHSFIHVPGMGLMTICAVGEVSARFSAQVSGAPSQFRMTVDGHAILMRPGWVTFHPPRARKSSFTFNFAQDVSTVNGSDSHTFEVHMRSPTGKRATMWKGTVNLQYERGPAGSGGACG